MFMSILIIFILAIVNPNEFIDIQLHDTYFVISPIHLGAILSFYLGLTGIIYWLLRKLSCVKWMTITHIIFTILACVFFQIFSLISSKFIEIDNNAIRIMYQIVTVIILFGILSQVIFVVNIFLSLIRKVHMD